MGIVLTDMNRYIMCDFGTHTKDFDKTEIRVRREGNFVYVKNEDEKEIKFYYGDFSIPVFVSSIALEQQFLIWINQYNTGGGSGFSIGERFEVFIAIAGQTVFTPVYFTPTNNTPVYVGGYLEMQGWNAIGGSIVFVSPVAAGTVVVIENPNNIIVEKTVQVYLATPGQTNFTPVFIVTPASSVYVSGYITVYGTDWTIIAGDVVLAVACLGGEVVIIGK